ncbi:MAG: hypothetical protein Q8Q31_05285 [Nanoarchaeota archaeon]|nr:hypothetical protein [Nanoarchaeota archaeon]
MLNPIKSAKKGIENFVNNHPFIAMYVGATVALNAVVYTALAGMEGIERACGVSPYNITATLKKKDVSIGSQGHTFPYGVFETRSGEQIKLMDYPAVTEGKLAAGTLKTMETNKQYNVKVFGSQKFIARIVDAEPAH